MQIEILNQEMKIKEDENRVLQSRLSEAEQYQFEQVEVEGKQAQQSDQLQEAKTVFEAEKDELR